MPVKLWGAIRCGYPATVQIGPFVVRYVIGNITRGELYSGDEPPWNIRTVVVVIRPPGQRGMGTYEGQEKSDSVVIEFFEGMESVRSVFVDLLPLFRLFGGWGNCQRIFDSLILAFLPARWSVLTTVRGSVWAGEIITFTGIYTA